MADTLESISTDGGTLWWRCPGEAFLEAVFNPFEPEITGKRQPLVSRIISLRKPSKWMQPIRITGTPR